MEGDILEIAKRLATDYGDPMLLILSSSMILIALLFLLSWFVTKRRFGGAGHEVPGGVVKDYLDSIIQNSTALRSSLFREHDDKYNSPSVIPVYKLREKKRQVQKSQTIDVTALQGQLSQRDKAIKQLEQKIQNYHDSQNQQDGEISELKRKLQETHSMIEEQEQSHHNDTQIEESSVEKDIFEMKQPKEQAAEHPEEEKLEITPEEENVLEMNAVEFDEEQGQDKEEKESAKAEDKTPEDLLDEFERMLG